ncbi:MAG: hypothetical protein KJ597_00855 [Nanoarchaeota archaeon]|nr:hypothetical protein [Nanoarchaeota archaeon]MBU1622101.1 hypothetical protein [Nanoarchaeota archaeon]
MKKRLLSLVIVFLLVLSLFVVAENGETSSDDECAGIGGWFKCLLFGDPSQRAVAGSAWWENE